MSRVTMYLSPISRRDKARQEYDEAVAKARSIGAENTFRLVWAYEMMKYRENTLPPPSPKAVLRTLLQIIVTQ